ncbi:MAG: S41 family peptidase [Patescibacteria group bacterium]
MKNIPLKVLVVFLTLAILGGVFWFGFDSGRNVPKTILVRGVDNIKNPGNITADFITFWEAWNLINKEYLKAPEVKNQDKVYGAISGLINSLGDPNSEFFNPDDGKKFGEDVQGNFGGIGAEIGMDSGHLIVVSPLKGTPAEKAGLKPKDFIVEINSTSTEGMSVEGAVKIIRGEIGTKVKLTIIREGLEKPRDFSITRENISIPTLDFEMKDGDIAYVALRSFNANANSLFFNAMTKILSNGSRGMVLDLRNNPGGFLQVAIDLAGWFLPRGTLVVKEASRIEGEKKFLSSGNAALKNFPVVVLMNGGSASASEILAGALRDQRQVKIIGEKSFGKGTVQQIESLSDGSSVKITIAHWIMPKGKLIDHVGIEPDFNIKLTDKDITDKKDPQLDKAIEILQTEIKKNKNTLFRLSDQKSQ